MRNNKLYLHLTGGLGNQMFQMAAALAVSNGRDIEIFSGNGKPRLNQHSEPEIFSFDLQGKIKFRASSQSNNKFISKILGYLLRTGISPVGIERNRFFICFLHFIANIILSFYMGERIKVYVSQDIGMSSEINPKANLLIGYFQSYHWEQKIKADDYFKIEEFYKSDTYQKYQEFTKSHNILAVHVRLGDYLNEDSFGIPNRTYYSTAISLLRAKFEISQIWIFTDSPELINEHFDALQDVEVILISKNEISSAETLEIMRLADHFVIANSSFSWWGATLSRKSSTKVVAPNPWFRKMASPKEIIPSGWITLDAWQNENKSIDK